MTDDAMTHTPEMTGCRRTDMATRVAIWLCMVCACQSAGSPTLAERCRRAAEARLPDAAELCLPVYELTADPAAGARAARAMQSRDGALPIIEWIANAVGDRPAGADAWLAAGVSRQQRGDFPAALAAFHRASDHRAASDTLGRLHDAVGLLNYHVNQAEYQVATEQAAVAYDLLSQVDGRDDRAVAYLNIAFLMFDVGSLGTLAQVSDQARSVISPMSRYYGYLRQLDAKVENAREHPALAQRALLEARALALRDGNADLELNVRMNMIEAALRGGAFDDAAALLEFRPPGDDALPNDRAVDAYLRGRLAMARGGPRIAVQLMERALPRAPEAWIARLEDVHGQALQQIGQLELAEQALSRSVARVELERNALNGDTFKSWLLTELREPFEDLFSFYLSHGRLTEAFAVVQRATARSILDGLLEAEPPAGAGIAMVGQRSEAMRKLARALRSSRAAVAPPITDVVARLRGHHVVTYFRARKELWAIAVASDGSLHARLIGDVATVAASVTAWRRNPEVASIADQLGTMLLPDELMPPPDAPLYIVADEPVAEVSFAALRRHGERVLDRHAVAYAPSAAVLTALRRSAAPIRALVLGDPRGDLPQARAEATEVAARLRVTPRLGADAARTVVLDAGDATLIHIAAHTELTPVGAALRLSDGLLDAGAVLDHKVEAGAIVLLTCSSAAITSRDELAPLAAAFLAAGAHTVVASRWAVRDEVGRNFAKMFYEDNGVIDPVRAVASAQRRLAADGVPVAQWSTFSVVGGLP